MKLILIAILLSIFVAAMAKPPNHKENHYGCDETSSLVLGVVTDAALDLGHGHDQCKPDSRLPVVFDQDGEPVHADRDFEVCNPIISFDDNDTNYEPMDVPPCEHDQDENSQN